MTEKNQMEFNNTDLLIKLYEMLFNDIITNETSKIISKFILDLIDNQEIDEDKFNIKEDLDKIYDICLEIYEE